MLTNRKMQRFQIGAGLFIGLSASACINALPAMADGTTLAKAKTVQVNETFMKADKQGNLNAVFNLTIKIQGPRKIRVESIPAKKTKADALYVVNGIDEHEYFVTNNTYRNIDSTPEGHKSSQIRSIASIDLIFDPLSKEPQGSGKVTITKDTVNGHPMTVRTELQPTVTNKDGSTTIYYDKTWVDSITGCPLKRTAYMTQNGKSTITLELRFSDWILDKPIPAQTFAFTLPADATEMGKNTPKLLTAGTVAPDFEANTPDGKKVHLSDFKGKTVILDFWATWCMPCQQSMPHLEKIYQQVKSKDVVVLAVCVWDKKAEFDTWTAANIGKKYNFPVAFDPAEDDTKSIAGHLYNVTGIPSQYVIDKDGKVATTIVGYSEGKHELETCLQHLGINITVAQLTK